MQNIRIEYGSVVFSALATIMLVDGVYDLVIRGFTHVTVLAAVIVTGCVTGAITHQRSRNESLRLLRRIVLLEREHGVRGRDLRTSAEHGTAKSPSLLN